MTLLQLEYFAALAKNLHYTRTAEELHISQPSLSYEIAELEKDLGAKLFTMEKRKVSLSEFGRSFLPYAKKALATLEAGREVLREKQTKAAHTIRLGYFHSIRNSLIPELVDGFRAAFPDSAVRFSFSEYPAKDIPAKLAAGVIDLGFALSGPETAAISEQPLYLVVPKGHPLEKRSSVDISELENDPLILLEQGTQLRMLTDELLEKKEILPLCAAEVPECSTAMQYVTMGYGVSILPPVEGFGGGKAVSIPVMNDGKPLTRKIYLLDAGKGQADENVAAFRNYVLNHH